MATAVQLIGLLAIFAGAVCKGSRVKGTFTCKGPEATPKDCSELPAGSVSGVYTIQPSGSHPYSVYCDMDTAGGGWTVFQRRQDGTVDFFRNWTDYENGFGSVSGEHWLGNAKIAKLTEQKNYSLRVDMMDFDNISNYALYDEFKVIADDNYRLQIGEYQDQNGTAGDAMELHNGMKFTTKDRDHDDKNTNCAKENKGGWWYKKCHQANLNGVYKTEGQYKQPSKKGDFVGIDWKPWKGYGYSLAFTEMKIKSND